MNDFLANNLIFDVYNIWYRVMWKNEGNLVKVDNKMLPVKGICNFFELTDSYIKKFGAENCKVYYLFDNAKTTLLKNRKELDEEYKKNRKIQPDYFYDGLNMVELILKFYRDNSVIYRKQGVEADDFVLPLIDTYISEHDKVILFSTDIDWCRALLDDNERDIEIMQYTRNNEILTVKTFEEKYGFKPTVTNVIFWKTFYGDESDNILPTISNFPKVYFLDVISHYNNLNMFLTDVFNGNISYLDKGWEIKIKQCEERMIMNWNLLSSIDLSTSELETWKIECFYKPNKLSIIYNTLGVMGTFDKRIKNDMKETDLWSMIDGEMLDRKKE